MTHAEVTELLGAYALDAIDVDERALVEDHLRDCPRCRAELAQHREVAAHLAYVGAPAPEGVWGRISAELGSTEPAPHLPRLYVRPRRWMAPAIGIAAAILALAVGALGWQLHNEQGKVVALQAQAGQVHLQQLMNSATTDSSSTRLALASVDRRIRVDVVLAADGTGYLSANGTLSALPDTQTYQLWGRTGDRTVSLGVIGNHPQVVAFPASAADFSAMALTVERAGGVVQTTHAPVAAGTVPHRVTS
jgi:anti-sigma-K factor RskA